MNTYDTDDTFLGRWIAGELSEEELIAFKNTKTYKQFKLINMESQLLSGPDIDVEKALRDVKQRLKQNKSKTKTVRLWQTISVAAILILALSFFFNSSKTYTTAIGQTQTILLEDGSKVYLNANSSLSLKRFFWSSNKTVNLNGEAYFVITKNNDFKVKTSKGLVKVLGTKFNIKDRSNFELKCYEGKVEFSQLNDSSSSKILTQGMQIIIDNDRVDDLHFKEESPLWQKGISKFEEQPLHLVLEELTQYFDINFDAQNINTNRLFSGSFDHNNLDLALKATLVPMGINYKVEQQTIILSE
ncbi:FecR family protein [Psychroserpens luteolus]|uniref:FecR family protein n=1 Tax=Psychroserpens luteolus TaxID=2855840 RepID=UPI001E54452B|nr:FecR family protein [Psychroserpens luteolus]MCD2258391.1 FecR family protein [Psychroserpens luteolus]